MRKASALLALATLASFATNAPAIVVLQDNFDGYADQAAFQAAWPAIGTSVTNPSALLSTTQSVSSPNSIRVPGTVASNEYRNRRSFAETGSVNQFGSKIIFSFDFWDAGSTAAPNPQRNFSNLHDTIAPGSTNQLIAMGFNNNQSGANSGGQYYMARILGYTVPVTPDPDGGATESVGGSGAFFKLNDFGVGLRSAAAAWVNLKVILTTNDGLSTDYEFYVNNVLAERVSNVGTAASIRSYDNIAIGSGLSNGSTQAFFDNMRLEYVAQVPEASSFLAVGLVGLVLGGAKWLRRKPTA